MNGHTLYRNIWLAQIPPTLDFLKKLIDENNFKYIVEIGTNRGGLSIWLNDHKHAGCKFMTLDITSQYLQFSPETEGIDFQLGSCFDTHKNKIIEILQQEGQVLLLCDGGNKNIEFNTFAGFLKTNDVIMCHDYIDDAETYSAAQSKYNWQTPAESSISEIKESVNKFNLQPYLYEDAKNSIWGCFKKS